MRQLTNAGAVLKSVVHDGLDIFTRASLRGAVTNTVLEVGVVAQAAAVRSAAAQRGGKGLHVVQAHGL